MEDLATYTDNIAIGYATKTKKPHSYEEALEKTKEYFMRLGRSGDELLLVSSTFTKKYALKKSQSEIFELTPHDMHKRIAGELARIESRYENPMSYELILSLLEDFKYIIPQGSPMTGIGNDYQLMSLGNCFVIGNPEGSGDSYGAIFRIDERIAQLQKRRAGVGTDLSDVRPAGSVVNNAALTSTGVTPFMTRYSNTTREVAQGGRRGALMETISIRHPEAESFIDAKIDTSAVTGANISVKIHDDFMESVIHETPYMQKWPIYSDNPVIKQTADAKKIWDKIIFNAWKSAEPGVLFWDQIIRESPADCYAKYGFRTTSTNPCGELPLCPGDSCRLLLLNLYSYVVNPFTKDAYFDFELFRQHVKYAQRMMDDIVDLEIEKIDAILDKIANDPEGDEIKYNERTMWEEVKQKCLMGRRTGTGVTGEGDMLAALGLTYGTSKATKFATEVHKELAISAYISSCIMAKERGTFGMYDPELEKENPFLNRMRAASPELDRLMTMYGRRNVALLTISPAGTVSIMSGTTSGIECVFLVVHMRKKKVNANDPGVNVTFVDKQGDSWEEYMVFHPKFETYLKVNGYDVDVVKKMSMDELDEIIKKSPYNNACSNDVDWLEKVTMQGEIQKWIDHSISVTVNLPKEATVELVDKVYKTAWAKGCKGCTIYRDGSRDGVLTSVEQSKQKADDGSFKENHAPKRPKFLKADVHRFMNKGEKWIGIVGKLEDRPYEIFTGPASSIDIPANVIEGSIRKSKEETGAKSYDFVYTTDEGVGKVWEGLNTSFEKDTYDMSRTFSAILRHGMPLPYVVDLIESLHLDGDLVTTWKNGFKRIIKKYIPDGTEVKSNSDEECPLNDAQKCEMVYQEGCLMCKVCGKSKCS